MGFGHKFISKIAVRIEFARSYMQQHYLFAHLPDNWDWQVDRQRDSRIPPDRPQQSGTQAE